MQCDGPTGKDAATWEGLLGQYRSRLVRMIEMRMDRRVRGRIDPSDVIQDMCIEASLRVNEYRENPTVSLYVWLRFMAVQRLGMLQRFHLRAQGRDVRREVPLEDDGACPQTDWIATHIATGLTSPSEAAMRAELKARLRQALERMEPIDHEVLVMRHFEELSNAEVAAVLGISPTAACNRYIRALERLKCVLAASLVDGARL